MRDALMVNSTLTSLTLSVLYREESIEDMINEALTKNSTLTDLKYTHSYSYY